MPFTACLLKFSKTLTLFKYQLTRRIFKCSLHFLSRRSNYYYYQYYMKTIIIVLASVKIQRMLCYDFICMLNYSLSCQGTNKVEGILIDLPDPDLIIQLSPKSFKKMKRLRLFINRNACFSEEPEFLPNELRLLDWPKYSGESLPSNFCGQNLGVLRMPYSHIKELKESRQNYYYLILLSLV